MKFICYWRIRIWTWLIVLHAGSGQALKWIVWWVSLAKNMHCNCGEALIWEMLHYRDVIMRAMASQITYVWTVSFNLLFGHRAKKISKLRVTCLCEGNLPVPHVFPSQRSSNAENFPFWCVYTLIGLRLIHTSKWSLILFTLPHTCALDGPVIQVIDNFSNNDTRASIVYCFVHWQ